jgi:hypothetical protein
VSGSSEASWAAATFTKSAPGAPSPTAPADNAVLQQPGSPPQLVWDPVQGAGRYQVQVSTDPNFTDSAQLRALGTDGAASLTLPDLQLPNVYFWKVRAEQGTSGIYTDWSPVRRYTVAGLRVDKTADPQAPANDINESVVDVVLDWKPIAGAASYDLQVGTDSRFLEGTIVREQNSILGTRWSPPQTLNNDQYYWRVRPVDAAGNRLAYSEVPIWRFRRHWPSQPALTYPADASTVGDPFYYQWQPVDHASSYQVQVSTSPSFTPAYTVTTCYTTHTTIVRGDQDWSQACFPDALGRYYWRVLARDDFAGPPPTSAIINATVRSYTYDPGVVTLTSPTAGQPVQVPTLTWAPAAGASRYRVTVTGANDQPVVSSDTATTTFTPEALEPGTYRWDVRTISEDGRLGAGRLLGSQRSFTLTAPTAPTASSPEPRAVPTGERFPTLRWTPVVDASFYRVWTRPTGAVLWESMPGSWRFPAADDRRSPPPTARSYQFYVQSYRSDGTAQATGNIGTYSIDDVPQVTDTSYVASLSGTAATSDLGTPADRCYATLPDECQNLRQTPVLSWTAPSANVGYYELYISRDAELTNLVGNKPFIVTNTMWVSAATLPDSQAGSAYYWEVRPCLTSGVCAPLTAATHAFNKQTRPATGLIATDADPTNDVPGDGVPFDATHPSTNPPVVANDVTLTWDDYLVSERVEDSTQDPDAETPLNNAATAEVRNYRVQTATDPNFQSTLETADVDQTTFTSFGSTYPEGRVYWRVQGFDGTGNAMAWSATMVFQKTSPKPVLGSPPSGANVRGSQPFSWTPLDFAASYVLEVYKNNDQLGSPANLVERQTTRQVSLTLSRSLPANTGANTGAYTWRVRRLDAQGREGAWSALRRFTVAGDAPTLLSPAPDVRVEPADATFAWSTTPEATAYRFERRPLSGTVQEAVTTSALSWSPTEAISGGSTGTAAWQWRVVAVDSAGRDGGATLWRDFTVTDTVTATTAPLVSGNGRVGTQLTVAPTTPSWNLEGVTTTFQWRRGGNDIAGATAAAYVVTSADSGQDLTVRATGTKAGYKAGTSDSNVVRASPGDAILATSPPSIRGNAIVRGVVSADPGSWPGSPTFAFAWTRDGVAINGATGRDYTIVPADAGRVLTVRVTATANGYDPGTASSGPLKVAKQGSQTTLTNPTPTLSAKARAKVTIKVAVNGVVDPTGTVQVLDGAKVVASAQLAQGGTGEVVVRLPKLKKGKHSIKASFIGNETTEGSSSGAVKVKVAGKKATKPKKGGKR